MFVLKSVELYNFLLIIYNNIILIIVSSVTHKHTDTDTHTPLKAVL